MALHRTIAGSGGGKLLDPTSPRINPFLEDRKKTFQPRALWENLLKLAILMFVFDVGIRRIQIDREEWLRFLALARAKLLRQAPAGPVQPDEALGTLLARRTAVRSTQPQAEPDPSLFSPTQEPVSVPADETSAPAPASPAPAAVAAVEPAPEPPADTTSRLLQAKKRAQQRRR